MSRRPTVRVLVKAMPRVRVSATVKLEGKICPIPVPSVPFNSKIRVSFRRPGGSSADIQPIVSELGSGVS